MSLENQVARVSQGTKDTLKALINMMGGNITDELIDQYPAIASQLLPPTGITGNTVTVTAQEQLDAGNMIVIVQNGDGYDAYKATNESLPISNFWLGIAKGNVPAGSTSDVTSIAYMESACDYVIEQNKNEEQKFWAGTEEEFKAITTKDPNTLYLVTDDCGAAKGYITEAEYAALLEVVNGKADSAHTHTKSDISDFSHGHEIADVNGLDAALSGKASTAHAGTHSADGSDPLTLSIAQITNLQSTLDGKANSGDVYSKTESDTLLANKRYYMAKGLIANSDECDINGVGQATVCIDVNGIARIDFALKITVNSTSVSSSKWGINPSLLTAINANIPKITPYSGGWLLMLDDNGAYRSQNGYGAHMDHVSGRWTPSRVYNDNGASGPWGASSFPVGSKLIGTCYGYV